MLFEPTICGLLRRGRSIDLVVAQCILPVRSFDHDHGANHPPVNAQESGFLPTERPLSLPNCDWARAAGRRFRSIDLLGQISAVRRVDRIRADGTEEKHRCQCRFEYLTACRLPPPGSGTSFCRPAVCGQAFLRF